VHAKLTIQTLGYAGLLPFYGFLAGFALLDDYPRALSVQGFLIYSLAILSFLGGTLWGFARTLPDGEQVARLVVSNGVVLFAVCCLLTAQTTIAPPLPLLCSAIWLWCGMNGGSTAMRDGIRSYGCG